MAAAAPIDGSLETVSESRSFGGVQGVYRHVSAFAPIVAPCTCPWGEKAFAGYLGDDRAAWQAYDATALVRRGARPSGPILIDQGADDPSLDTQLRPHLLQEACRKANVPLELRMHSGYDHGYYFISSVVDDHLKHHADARRG